MTRQGPKQHPARRSLFLGTVVSLGAPAPYFTAAAVVMVYSPAEPLPGQQVKPGSREQQPLCCAGPGRSGQEAVFLEVGGCPRNRCTWIHSADTLPEKAMSRSKDPGGQPEGGVPERSWADMEPRWGGQAVPGVLSGPRLIPHSAEPAEEQVGVRRCCPRPSQCRHWD